MATSNRDRVGHGFELLADGLLPFVDARMSLASANAGGDWIALLEARDAAKHDTAKTLDRRDPALHLRVITEEWRVFKDALSHAERSFASELRETRNRWAHNSPFTADDAYRALANLGQEILSQLAAVDGAALEVTVEVHARAARGFGDDKVRAVLENARTLRFEQANFEDD